MKKIILLLFLVCSAFAASAAEPFDNELLELAKKMEGDYNTVEQARIDTSYFDIRLHMKRVWTDRTDAIWLYVEQAVAKSQDKPYRQRVYRLTKVGYNLFESEIYELKEPLRFAGEWKKDVPLAGLTPDSLTTKGGCAVTLKKVAEGVYSGSTDGEKCLSGWRGAKYATSIVTIIPGGMISWDRGYDENDNYLWGAEKAGYFFKKEN